jgi:1,5-anhydro-D-fructose reductase (1,5-anhydro-D-mannitol-forming)
MTVRWGIIGAGGIAVKRMIPAMLLSEHCTLEAVMRTDQAKLAELQQQYSIRHAYATAEELVKSGDIDAIYIATPVYAHAEQAIMCVESGIPVLIEKPVGLNVQELNEIRRACHANNVFFDGALMMRYHSLHLKMREMIMGGMIGSPIMARMDFCFWYPEEKGSWRQKKSLGGGGVFMDLGPHCLDLIQFVTGRQVKKIKAALMNTQTFSYEVEDSASVLLEMEGGVHAMISTHFNIPENVAANRLEVYGTNGTLVLEGTLGQVECGRLLCKLKGEVDFHVVTTPKQLQFNEQYSLYVSELEHFIEMMEFSSGWEIAMDEQIRLQTLVDDIYKMSV